MKIILTGATGVLGSHIMYDILEHYINNNIDGKLYLIKPALTSDNFKVLNLLD